MEHFNDDDVDNNDVNTTKTTRKHVACSYGYYIKCDFNKNLSRYVSYRGINCAKHFVTSLKKDTLDIFNLFLSKNKTLSPLTPSESKIFSSSNTCHICEGYFQNMDDGKVKDHCHLTGIFRGAAHRSCNLKFRIPKYIPIFFHNLSGYDSHLFIKEIAEIYPEDELTIIPLNVEKYISFSQKISEDLELRFLDSYRFMETSLSNLCKILDKKKFFILDKTFSKSNSKFLKRKGIYPYEYMDSINKFNEIILPSFQNFSNISQDDYNYANFIWKQFNIKNMGEYSDLYLKTDVIILADIFENFRNICLKIYGLDPNHYYTSPGLSWDAMLKFTKVDLELISDLEMIGFLKKGIRGGMSQCSNRHAIANNKYMESFDPKKAISFLLYLDANNLYGWAMSQKLPYGSFQWLTNSEIEKINIKALKTDSSYGYIFEVDIDYPDKLHKSHNDLPLCPENMIPPNAKLPKLIPNLMYKNKYVIHFNTLKQYLNYGLEVKHIHRVLKFRQKNWLKSYIDLNTKCRQNATNDFEKVFFKLMNNSIYGKTMENIEKYRDIKLISNWKKDGNRNGAENLISKPNFHSCTIFTENFVAIEMKKTKLVYNKPIYIGLTVLDLSKSLMYYFHYGVMQKKYEENLTLLYTDTDSLIYQVKTNDFYDDLKKDPLLLNMFDTSDYCDKYDIECRNKKEIGKFKDESKTDLLIEFVGLRSKVYALKFYSQNTNDHNTSIIKKAKGVDHTALESITLDDYFTCLTKGSIKYCSIQRFRNIKHTIYSQTLEKVALCNEDTKRYLIPNSIKTYAWGSYLINS